MILFATLVCTYTNLAGKVIVGEPVRMDGARVTFACAVGARTLPLDVFPAIERARIGRVLGVREVPPALRGLADEIAAQRRRAEARAKAGRLKPEKLVELREGLAASWCAAVETAALTDEERAYWKGNVP